MTYHDILNIIIFNRVKIIKVTVTATVFIFLILFFIYPRTYHATVTILPPEGSPQLSGFASVLGEQNLSNFMTGSGTNANSQLYMEILKSRTAALYVVKKDNLQNFYKKRNIYIAAQELDKNLNVDVSKERIISLSVNVSTSLFPFFTNQSDSVKNLAASISNNFVEALDKINREKLNSKAKESRIFIGQQLRLTRGRMDSVENALMLFQKKNKAVSLPQQVNAAIDAAAKLKTEIMKTEIEIGMVEPNLRSDNKYLIMLKEKLKQIKDQYSKMEMGSQDYLITFREVPELGKKLANLLREVKIQNEVYSMLQQEYYKEKIQESKDIPTVQVLDPAIPPLAASAPRTVFSSIVGGIFVFILMSLIFVVSERKTYSYKKEGKED